jgi:hypothetical protein
LKFLKKELAKRCIFRCVFKASKNSYTISCSDPDRPFKSGTSPEQLQKFREWIAGTFEELVKD